MKINSLFLFWFLLLFSCKEFPQSKLQEIYVHRLDFAKPKVICFSAADSTFFLGSDGMTISKLDINFKVIQNKKLFDEELQSLFADELMLFALSKKRIYFVNKSNFEIIKKINISKVVPRNGEPVCLAFNPISKTYLLVVQTRLPIVYELDPVYFRKVSSKKVSKVSRADCGFVRRTSLFLVNADRRQIFELDIANNYDVVNTFTYSAMEVTSATYADNLGLILLSQNLRRIFIYKF